MMMLNVILQASPGAGSGQMMSILMIVAMIAIFYFFMIRPQQKKQKELQKARETMKTGDKVILAGGIHGKIKEISDNNSMLIEVADGVRIRVEKSSIFAAGADANTTTV
jgi:preprotein translocase subunit YajC